MESPSDTAVLQERKFLLQNLIGEGSYAKVYRAVHMLDETRTTELACKVIDTASAPRDYLYKFLPRELDVLIRVNHPHIIQVTNIFQRRAKYFIFMRIGENGDLLHFISKNGAIPEAQSRVWMRQLISALDYMHTLNIAHRDLKCENVLITSNYNVKLTDFGFARSTRNGGIDDLLSETFCGSLLYAAPEVLKGVPYKPKLADIWSMGIILYTMLNRALPFNESSVKVLYEKQVQRKWRFRTRVVNELSAECKQQVTDMMNPDAHVRPTADLVFKGPWISMDPRLVKLTILEDTLLKQAKDDVERRGRRPERIENEAATESATDIKKGGLKTLKKYDLQQAPGVYKCVHQAAGRKTGTVLACKVIDTATAPRDYLNKFLPRELDILIRVNHPHIIQVTNIFQRRAKYFVFMRFGEVGDLFDFVSHNGRIPENQSRFWMRQLISGLNYIHTLNIAHRDLKCENVIITANFNVKLTDFGFARVVRRRDTDLMSETYCGTLSYAAPEVLKGVPYLPKLADIWSMGIILYTMLNQSLPFKETNVKLLYEKQIKRQWRFRTSVVNDLSPECKQQVTQLMEPDAASRPTAASVFSGRWIAMDQRLIKLSFLEESLLKKATATAKQMKNDDDELATLRSNKGSPDRSGLKSLKSTSTIVTHKDSLQMF